MDSRSAVRGGVIPKVVLAVLPLLAFLSGGCATIMQPADEVIVIRSTPEGARFQVKCSPPLRAPARVGSGSGKAGQCSPESGTTPAEVAFRRGGVYIVHLEKEGFYPARVHLTRVENPAIYLNLLLWPLTGLYGVAIGLMVDATTGASWRLDGSQEGVSFRHPRMVSEGDSATAAEGERLGPPPKSEPGELNVLLQHRAGPELPEGPQSEAGGGRHESE